MAIDVAMWERALAQEQRQINALTIMLTALRLIAESDASATVEVLRSLATSALTQVNDKKQTGETP